MSRSQELLDAVKEFNHAHESWVRDPNTDFPTGEYWRAFDELSDKFKSGEIPENRRELTAAVFDLLAEYEVFSLQEELNPHEQFWAAREKVENICRRLEHPAEKPRRETIKQLDREKVPHEQIARIWGLTKPDGSGKAWLIQQELDDPGSVITDEFVHPDDRQDEAPVTESRQRYEALAQQREVIEPVQEEQPCPETSEELWRQKVPLKQAARMLMRPEIEVQREWMALEIQYRADQPDVDDLESADDKELRAELRQFNYDMGRGRRTHEQLVAMVRDARAQQAAAKAIAPQPVESYGSVATD